MKLVPLDRSLGYTFQLHYPDGWHVTASISHDALSIDKLDLDMHVVTRQLRDVPAPMTEPEMLKSVVGWAPDAVVRQIQVPGTVSAFEMTHKAQGASGGQATVLEVHLFGTRWKESLSFSAPSNTFTEWEPIFRMILDSYQHSDLDKMTPNGRP